MRSPPALVQQSHGPRPAPHPLAPHGGTQIPLRDSQQQQSHPLVSLVGRVVIVNVGFPLWPLGCVVDGVVGCCTRLLKFY